jgi:hypothetical protein
MPDDDNKRQRLSSWKADEIWISVERHRRTNAVGITFDDSNTIDVAAIFAGLRECATRCTTRVYDSVFLKGICILVDENVA